MDDATFNIPYIIQVYNDPALFSNLLAYNWRHVCNVFIVSEDPIMTDSAADELLRNQKRGCINNISISLTLRTTYTLSNIHNIRATFKQVWPIVSYFAFVIKKNSTPSDIGKCLSNPHHHHWISGIFAQYDKILRKMFSLCFSPLRMSPPIRNSCSLSYHQR